MGIIVSACPTSEHISADAEHVSVDAEHVSVDAEHVSTDAEFASADTVHVCLSAGTVLVSAIHAFGYLAINEESHFRHRDDVRMAFLLLYDKMY